MSSSNSLIWRLLELWRTLLSYRKKAFALRSYKTNYSLLQILQILNYQNQRIRKERLHNWYPSGKYWQNAYTLINQGSYLLGNPAKENLKLLACPESMEGLSPSIHLIHPYSSTKHMWSCGLILNWQKNWNNGTCKTNILIKKILH